MKPTLSLITISCLVLWSQCGLSLPKASTSSSVTRTSTSSSVTRTSTSSSVTSTSTSSVPTASTSSSGATTASTSSSVPTATVYSTLINASYDDYPAAIGAEELNPISIYDGLMYNDFSVSNTTVQVSGLGPHSKPNLITSSPSQQLTAIPGVTVVYSASPYSSFSLLSFYFGCFATTAQGVVASTAACTLQVTSYTSGSTNPAAIANFEFTPPVSDETSAPPIEAVLPAGFSNVTRVTFQQSPSATDGFGLDNMFYYLNW